MITYGFSKEIDTPFTEAVEEVTQKLSSEGFGVLTKVDIREKFKDKLGIDFKNYVILGACNPANAHRRDRRGRGRGPPVAVQRYRLRTERADRGLSDQADHRDADG